MPKAESTIEENALKVTSGYLRRRFWISAMVVLVPLTIATVLSALSLNQNIIANRYAIAFGVMSDAIMRLDAAMTSSANDHSMPMAMSRQHSAEARRAFDDLLTVYSALRVSDPDGDALLTGPKAGQARSAITEMTVRRGIVANEANAAMKLDGADMPEELEAVWEAGSWDVPVTATSSLELEVAHILLAAAPVFDEEETPKEASQRAARQVHGLIDANLRAKLGELGTVLLEIMERSAFRPVVLLLAIFSLVVLAMLLAAFVVIRPLEISVLSAQRELVDERQNARAADVAKSEFLATMSHEIRTPLNGVLGMAELLESTELDDRQKMFTEIVRSSGQALLGVINDILDFSKIDAGRLEIDPQPFELEVLASESARLIGRAAEAKGLDLLVRLQPGLPSAVIGDLGRIRQVITNLLSNAVKFTQRGQIVVDLSGAERYAADGARLIDLRVEVRDTGHGIAPDRIAKMFERFTQADSSHSRLQEGTGLGLAISKGLIELMGGQIGAVSQLNQGSTFWFTLSLPVDGTGERALGMSSEVEGRRVLVIDGNETNPRFLQEQLAAWRLVTAAASSGRVGLQRLLAAERDSTPFDLVVLDQGLPDMAGEEFMRTLRASPLGMATPAIILTSMSAEREGTAMTQPGGLQYVIKPALASVLFDAIAVALAGRPALAAADRGPVAADTTNPQSQQPGATVLLVEDNHINSLYAGQLLDISASTMCWQRTARPRSRCSRS